MRKAHCCLLALLVALLLPALALAAPPDPPTNLRAEIGDRSVTLRWDPPKDDGGSTIYNYTVGTVDELRTASVGTATSYTFSGLGIGPYEFKIIATNADGHSDYAYFPVVTTDTVPNKMRPAAYTVGSGSVVLSWGPPSSDGSPVTKVVVSEANGRIDELEVMPNQYMTAISSLTNGVEYIFQLQAFNAVGPGPIAAFDPMVPNKAPNAPQNVQAEPGNHIVILSWEAPIVGPGDGTVDGYLVSKDPSRWFDVGNILSYSFPSLTNGETYNSIGVRAYNNDGHTNPGQSDIVYAPPVTPDVVPDAVVVLPPVPGDREAFLQIQQPTSGGSPVTKLVISEKDGKFPETDGILNTQFRIYDLTNGVEYNFQIHAVNAMGAGPISKFEPFVPNTAPGVPRNPQAEPGNQSITLTWQPPTTGYGTVDGYKVTSDFGRTWIDVGNTLSHTFQGLTNGTAYTLGVRAYNNLGYSNYSESTPAYTPAVAPDVVPNAPENLQAIVKNQMLIFSWNSPIDNGGTQSLEYQCTIDGINWDHYAYIDPISVSTPPLTNGVAYTFQVRAVNAMGPGAIATITETPNVTPHAPQNVRATPGDQSATLTWEAPTTGDGAVDGYQVWSGIDAWVDVGNVLSHQFTGLQNGVEYTLVVRARNNVGNSGMVSATVTPAGNPGMPQNVRATPGNQSATLTWEAPTDTGGSPVLEYNLYLNNALQGTTTQLAYDFTGLQNGAEYTLGVAAVTQAGESGIATAKVTPVAAPGMPQNVRATPGNQAATLTWEAPTDTGGSPVLGYRVSEGGALWQDLPPDARTHTFGGLTNGTAYTLYVKAFTAIGDSQAATAAATPQRVPAAPDLVRPTVSDTILLGTAEPGAAVTITISGTNHTATADASGNWQLPLPAPLTLTDTITAYQTVGGVDGPATAPITPLPASETTLTIDPIYENDPFITGTCESGAQIYLVFGGSARRITPYGTVGAGALAQMPGSPASVSGTRWSYNVSGLSLQAGDSVTVIQAVGGVTKNVLRATVASRSGTLPPVIINPVQPGDTEISGTAIPGATVTITGPDGNPIGTTTADENGNWTYPLPAPIQPDDVYLVTQTVAPLTSAPIPAALASSGKAVTKEFEAPPSGYGVITGSRVNARERPSLDATVLTQLSQGTRVRIVDWGMTGDDGSGPWCKITVGDQMYFVHNDYVDGTAPF